MMETNAPIRTYGDMNVSKRYVTEHVSQFANCYLRCQNSFLRNDGYRLAKRDWAYLLLMLVLLLPLPRSVPGGGSGVSSEATGGGGCGRDW